MAAVAGGWGGWGAADGGGWGWACGGWEGCGVACSSVTYACVAMPTVGKMIINKAFFFSSLGRRGGGKRKKETTKEGKTKINLQAEEARDSSWLPRDTFGFITDLIKYRGWWPTVTNPSLQRHWVWTKAGLHLFHLPLSQPLVPGGPLCQEELSWALTQGQMVQCPEGSYRLGTVLYVISF